jgi:hypothetical protein
LPHEHFEMVGQLGMSHVVEQQEDWFVCSRLRGGFDGLFFFYAM